LFLGVAVETAAQEGIMRRKALVFVMSLLSLASIVSTVAQTEDLLIVEIDFSDFNLPPRLEIHNGEVVDGVLRFQTTDEGGWVQAGGGPRDYAVKLSFNSISGDEIGLTWEASSDTLDQCAYALWIYPEAQSVDIGGWSGDECTGWDEISSASGVDISPGEWATLRIEIADLAMNVSIDNIKILNTGDIRIQGFPRIDVVSHAEVSIDDLKVYYLGEVGDLLEGKATEPVEPVLGYAGCVVTSPPPELELDPFYEKYCAADGLPIVSSANVPDMALKQAWNVVMNTAWVHPDVIDTLINNNIRVGVIGADENLTDMPEYRILKDDPGIDWDRRARGLGASLDVPLVSGAEENLLCYRRDRYYGESIFLHEFAHALKNVGLEHIDSNFAFAVLAYYNASMSDGRWDGLYAGTDAEEYWAEGIQSYFDANLQAIPPDGVHNHVDTRDELAEYDPILYGLLDMVFLGFEWSPTCPCAVSASESVDLRAGPGMASEVIGRLPSATTVYAVEQTTGTDNLTWLRLESGMWVQTDIVHIEGDCDRLPVIDE
jgi:hypothetical protein